MDFAPARISITSDTNGRDGSKGAFVGGVFVSEVCRHVAGESASTCQITKAKIKVETAKTLMMEDAIYVEVVKEKCVPESNTVRGP